MNTNALIRKKRIGRINRNHGDQITFFGPNTPGLAANISF